MEDVREIEERGFVLKALIIQLMRGKVFDKIKMTSDTSFVPGTVLKALQGLFHLILRRPML